MSLYNIFIKVIIFGIFHSKYMKHKKLIQFKKEDTNKISVIIPFYNEELFLERTLKKITSIGIKGEILLVNNCSNDRSTDIVHNFIIRNKFVDLDLVHLFCSEKGKGNALICGFNNAKYETILMTDADDEFNILEYPKLIDKYRKLSSKYIEVVAKAECKKKIKSILYSNLYNLLLKDNYSLSGTRIFPTSVIKEIISKDKINQKDFCIELNISRELHKYGLTYEVPITYNRRTVKEGKKLSGRNLKKFQINSLKFLFKQFLHLKKKNNYIINNNEGSLHLGFILDGNRRFSKLNNIKSKYQHLIGLLKLNEIINFLNNSKRIKYATLYCFAENNWKREKQEIDNIFNLLNNFRIFYERNSQNIKVNIISTDKSKFTKEINNNIQAIHKISNKINNPNLICNMLLSYSGRSDILQAAKKSDKNLEKNLLTSNLPDIDLLIRTGGDSRLSDFSLYNCAYTEFYFLNKKFPEVKTNDIKNIINKYDNARKNLGK